MTDWTKTAWRRKPRVQMPDYPEAEALGSVEGQLRRYPPLVFAGEARGLKKHLGAASRGEACLLQAAFYDARRGKGCHCCSVSAQAGQAGKQLFLPHIRVFTRCKTIQINGISWCCKLR